MQQYLCNFAQAEIYLPLNIPVPALIPCKHSKKTWIRKKAMQLQEYLKNLISMYCENMNTKYTLDYYILWYV